MRGLRDVTCLVQLPTVFCRYFVKCLRRNLAAFTWKPRGYLHITPLGVTIPDSARLISTSANQPRPRLFRSFLQSLIFHHLDSSAICIYPNASRLSSRCQQVFGAFLLSFLTRRVRNVVQANPYRTSAANIGLRDPI